MVPNETSMLEAALKYAELGWNIHPLKPASKMPNSPHGFLDATTDLTRIRRWWESHEDDNIGVATGLGIYVLDIDGPIGAESLNALVEEFGPLPETLTAQTGKGLHYFFAYTGDQLGNTASKLGKGIDTRGTGGYTVLAPSIHPDGRRYKWLNPDMPLAQLPVWVVTRLQKITWITPPDPNPFNKNINPYVKKVWDRVKDELIVKSQGDRNDALNNAAFLMGGWIASGEISRSEVEAKLGVIASGIGLGEAEICKTIKSGIESGMNFPLSVPPGHSFSHQNYHQAQARLDEGTVNIARGSTFGRRKVEFFWGKRIPIGKLTILGGRGGVGKSFLTLSLAAHITADKEILGLDGNSLSGEVLFCSYEDDVEDSLGPRADYLGVDMDKCHFITGVDTGHGKRPFGPQDCDRIVDYLKQCPNIKLIIIDPLGSFVGAGTTTNAENEMRAVLQTLVDAAQEINAAVLVVAHLRKADVGSGVDDQALAISGSQGISAIARSVLLVERDENNLRWVKHVKCNYSAKAPDISYDFNDDGFFWKSVSLRPEDHAKWLKSILEIAGGEMEVNEIYEKGRLYGRSEDEINQGRASLGLIPVKDGETWLWKL